MSQLAEIKADLETTIGRANKRLTEKYMAFIIHILNGNMDKAEKKKKQIENLYSEELDKMMYEGGKLDSRITIIGCNVEYDGASDTSEAVRVFAEVMKHEYHNLAKAIKLGLRLQWATQFIKK
jgi:hypothetical protein